MMRRAPVRWLALWLACTAAREVNRSAPLPTQLKAFRAKSCPEIDCDHLGPPATYTGKYAVFMSGRLRVAHAMLTAAMKQIEDKYSGSITVDWYLHVWYNETALCERRALEELRTIATAITTEPVECMWSWGNGWQNQWHGVDFAWRTLERFGDPAQYTLILKSRVDVSYDDLDFEAVWKRYSAAPATKAAGGHFIVFGRSQGWDVHMIGTPPLVRAMARYDMKPDPFPTYGCDSTIDSFPFQRMFRYGCWPPTADPAQKPLYRKFYETATKRESRGLEPRCAPLFVDVFPSSIKRPYPFLLNPNTDPRLGCNGRRLAVADVDNATRRLAARVPDGWVMPDDAFCDDHRHDVYYVSPGAHHHSAHGAQPAARCPPACAVDGPATYEEQVTAAAAELRGAPA